MKIAIYVYGGQCPPEADKVMSGHVQMPLKTAELLLKRGYEVTLITTEAPPNYRIPPVISLDKLEIRIVRKIRADFLNLPAHLSDLKNVISQNDFDLLHFFGANKTAYLLGLIKASGIKTKSLMTMINYLKPQKTIELFIQRKLFNHIYHFIALTEYTKEGLTKSGFKNVSVTFPGVLKRFAYNPDHSIKIRPEATDLVLFWRTATFDNGIDICIKVFRKLSKEFESADFVFAVRAQHQFKGLFSKLVMMYKNIHLLQYPYKKGVTISKLLNSASCVVMPFRRLSINPQISVLETLSSGAPLVTTFVESNRELIEDNKAIYFVEPSNIHQTYLAVKYLLENKAQARKMGEKARSQAAKKWNWQVYEKQLMDVYKRFT